MRFFYPQTFAMKILFAKQIQALDEYTIAHEPIASIDLMERASSTCASWLFEHFRTREFAFFCGGGNNGGDGLAIARLISELGAKVQVWCVYSSQSASTDHQINLHRLTEIGISVQSILSQDQFPDLDQNTVVVDALLGTGLTRPLTGLLEEAVCYLNRLSCTRIAIDIPTGMFAEAENEGHGSAILKADHTLSFEVPKLSFFLPSMASFVGNLHILPIGLNAQFIAEQKSALSFLQEQDIAPLLQTRNSFAHKGTFGHSLIIAGSYGKVGAAILATKAALRSGSGLVSAFVPKCAYSLLQCSAPESMVSTANEETFLKGIPDLTGISAIGIGPGIGQESATGELLAHVLKNTTVPLVLDADALNLLAAHPEWMQALPKGSVLTPHVKEFERLFDPQKSSLTRLLRQQEVAQKFGIYIVLKGHNSSIAFPDGRVFFNSTGNPGMAAGGSGDVLTGLLTGLLAQSYSAEHAILLGVYLHGLAGDFARNQLGEEAMIASDIIDHFGSAFLKLRATKNSNF